MRQRIGLFILVLISLSFAPQAQAQYRCRRPWRATDYIQANNHYIDMMAARECSGPYPPGYCFGNYGYDGRYGYRDQRYDRDRGYETDRRTRDREYGHREERQERPAPRHNLIPMTNRTHFLAIVYDGDVEVARIKPGEFKNLPEPRERYHATLRTVVGDGVHYEPVNVSHNNAHSGWEINEPEKE